MIQEISTGSESMVTNLAFAPTRRDMFVASFGDGEVMAYDTRLGKKACMQSYRAHRGWVKKACWKPGGEYELISAWYVMFY